MEWISVKKKKLNYNENEKIELPKEIKFETIIAGSNFINKKNELQNNKYIQRTLNYVKPIFLKLNGKKTERYMLNITSKITNQINLCTINEIEYISIGAIKKITLDSINIFDSIQSLIFDKDIISITANYSESFYYILYPEIIDFKLYKSLEMILINNDFKYFNQSSFEYILKLLILRYLFGICDSISKSLFIKIDKDNNDHDEIIYIKQNIEFNLKEDQYRATAKKDFFSQLFYPIELKIEIKKEFITLLNDYNYEIKKMINVCSFIVNDKIASIISSKTYLIKLINERRDVLIYTYLIMKSFI